MKVQIICIVFAIIFSSADVFADTFFTPKMVETAHTIKAKLVKGRLKMKVSRVFQNLGSKDQELHLAIDLEPKTKIGELEFSFDGKWVKSKLLSRAEARASYYPKGRGSSSSVVASKVRPHALLEKDGGRYILRVSPVAGSGSVRVRYALESVPDYSRSNYTYLYRQASDRKRFVSPLFSYEGRWWSEKKPARKGGSVEIGYQKNPLCSDLRLPDNCHFIEIDLLKGDEKDVLYLKNVVTGFSSDSSTISLLDPNLDSVPLQNCAHIRNRVQCRTPIAQKKGKWRLAISVDPSLLPIGLSAETQGTKVKHDFFVGYRRLYFPAKTGPDEVKLGHHPRTRMTDLEVKFRQPFSLLPKKARMIFVVDASLSVREDGVRRQLALLKSIAKHTKDETIEVVVYNRFVSHFTINPEKIDSELEKHSHRFRLKNGSDMLAALKKVMAITQNEKRPTLVYALSDFELVASSFRNSESINFPKKVVLHSIGLHGLGMNAIERDERSGLVKLAASTGGASFQLSSNLEDKLDEESLHLVRPTRIEKRAFNGRGWAGFSEEKSTMRFQEYRSLEEIEFTGLLWQKKLVRTFKRTPKGDEHQMWRLIYEERTKPKEEEKFVKKNKFVTNYFSLAGLENAQRARVENRNFGRGFGRSSSRYGTAPYLPIPIFRPIEIADSFRSIGMKCAKLKVGQEKYRASLTTIDSEIVSVVRDEIKETDWTRCLHESVWDTELPKEVRSGNYTLNF